jgi:pimeloyl-ACP methyl ester carboxylesterase
MAPVPVQWQVNGLQLAGLSWGTPGAHPLLALHRWLDNAASFSVLGPHLRQHHVVAVDLTGHGLSAHRSPDATYQIWDDLPELLGILDALGWERFSLMGHSRGAFIAGLLASTIPERVDALVLLDGLAPSPVNEAAFPGQLRQFLKEKRRWSQRDNRIYANVAAALAASRKHVDLEPADMQALVERNLRPCAGGYTWTTDLRLRGASAVKLSEGQIHAVLGALSMPTLLMLAEQGFGRQGEVAALAGQQIRRLQLEEVGGGHHFHMGPGAAMVASRISSFLLDTGQQEHDE